MTELLYTGTGLAGILCYRHGWYVTAFMANLAVTQIWRVFSEFLRDDYRGDGKISAYQIMGAAGVVYSAALLPFITEPGMSTPDLTAGAGVLWAPLPLLMIQLLWCVIFLYTGRSRVTGATLNFHVEQHQT